MNGTNGNEPGYPENALVPYPVIVAATSSHQNNRRPCTSADWKSRSALHRFQGYASDWKWNCFRLAARPHGKVLGKGR